MKNIVRSVGTSILVAAAGAACSASPGSVENDSTQSAESNGATSEAISTSQFCSALNKALTFVLPGGVKIPVAPGCNDDNANSVSYFGSSSPGAPTANGQPKLHAEALYCAVAAADGHSANAYVDTSLGKMGANAWVNITTKDPASLHVAGQRIGRLVAFGHMMDIESQEFDFAFPTEYQIRQNMTATGLTPVASPNGHGVSYIPSFYTQTVQAQMGQYGVLTESGHHFDLAASIAVPTPVPGLSLTAGMEFRHETPYDSANSSAVAMSTPGKGSGAFSNMFGVENDSETARKQSWATMTANCNACLAAIPPGGLNVCGASCPDAHEQAGHDRDCVGVGTGPASCSDAYYRNLSDGRLPYEGDYGATGPFVSNTSSNWWHFGTPSSGHVIPTVAGEPIYSLAGNFDPATATSHLEVDLGLAYGYKIFDVGLQIKTMFDFRNGMAVRESTSADPDSSQPPFHTAATWLDAEGRTHITADFAVSANIPFVGKETILHESFTIIDSSVRSNSSAARVSSSASWNDTEPSALSGYNVGGVDTPVSSCLNVPAATKAAIVTDNPVDFANAVGQSAHDSLYPCNIQICDPTTAKLQTCTWSTATNAMTCATTTKSCGCGDNSANMCDASGKVYSGIHVGATYCPQTCGTHLACSAASDCGTGTGWVCDTGCCEAVK